MMQNHDVGRNNARHLLRKALTKITRRSPGNGRLNASTPIVQPSSYGLIIGDSEERSQITRDASPESKLEISPDNTRPVSWPEHSDRNVSIARTNSHESIDPEDKGSLCKKCQYVFDHWYRIPDLGTPGGLITTFQYYSDTSLMKVAADHGCSLCGQFLHVLDCRNVVEDVTVVSKLFVSPIERMGSLHWKMWLHYEHQSRSIALQLIVSASPTEDGKSNSLSTQHENNIDFSLPLMNRWIDKCVTTHVDCMAVEEAFMPTRLIFVGDHDICLVLGSDLKRKRRYATLSHCWGDLKYLTLRESNLQSFLKEIPPEALPQTFRDAIEITRSLGIKYLWIDSLCIIQDKHLADWAKESSQMAKVYGSSFINIAATAAVDSTMGLYVKEKQRNNLFRTAAVSSTGNILCQCVPISLYSESVSKSPLAQRGWVVQERLLASRTIHFTQSQIFWECNESITCKAFPDQLPDLLRPWANRSTFLEKKPLPMYSWKEIVEHYSQCKLTFTKDKLVAISGVARALQMNRDVDYLAGMWRGDDFIRRLHWKLSEDAIPAPRPTEYRAPSWSWASVDSAVELPPQAYKSSPKHLVYHAKLLDTHFNFAGPDQFGAISSASLVLQCDVLLRVTSDQMQIHQSTARIHDEYFRMMVSYDYSDETEGDFYLIPLVSESMLKELDKSNADDFLGHFCGVTLLAPESWLLWVEGLILRRCNSEPGHYRRVGAFRLYSPSNRPGAHLPTLELDVDQPDYSLHLSEYEKVDLFTTDRQVYTQYTITLV